MFGGQLHNRFLPAAGGADAMAISPRLTLAVLGHDLVDLYVKQLLDSATYIGLGSLRVYLERVVIVASRTVDTFFGNQRSNDHLMRFKLNALGLSLLSHCYGLACADFPADY